MDISVQPSRFYRRVLLLFTVIFLTLLPNTAAASSCMGTLSEYIGWSSYIVDATVLSVSGDSCDAFAPFATAPPETPPFDYGTAHLQIHAVLKGNPVSAEISHLYWGCLRHPVKCWLREGQRYILPVLPNGNVYFDFVFEVNETPEGKLQCQNDYFRHGHWKPHRACLSFVARRLHSAEWHSCPPANEVRLFVARSRDK